LTVWQIPGFREHMLRLREWLNEGLIHFWTRDNYKYIDPYLCATVLTNVQTYLHPERADSDYLVNAEEYVMYLFNKNGIKYSGCKTTKPYKGIMYIGADSGEPESILDFIDWIYSDQENYESFIYGEEGVDYETDDDGGIVYLQDKGRSYWGEKQLAFFQNNNLERPKSYMPDNWEDVLEIISIVPSLTDNMLYDYIFRNTETTHDQLSVIYANYLNDRNILTSEQRLAIYGRTDDFLNDMYMTLKKETNEVIDEYISDVSDMPGVKKGTDIFYSYMNDLMECIDQ
jgi:hypothetical protein